MTVFKKSISVILCLVLSFQPVLGHDGMDHVIKSTSNWTWLSPYHRFKESRVHHFIGDKDQGFSHTQVTSRQYIQVGSIHRVLSKKKVTHTYTCKYSWRIEAIGYDPEGNIVWRNKNYKTGMYPTGDSKSWAFFWKRPKKKFKCKNRPFDARKVAWPAN